MLDGEFEAMGVIKNYNDFVTALLDAGFSMSVGGGDGIYSVLPWGWDEPPPYSTPVRWHTGDPDTDPWEWRMRVLEERDDVAYAKLFFKKSGFIAREWYPYFLSARRGGLCLEDAYYGGAVSNAAKRVYDAICANGALPLHAIKQIAGLSTEDSSKVDAALNSLQMGMYITICGRQQKLSKQGLEYGWYSTVFTRVEDFWGAEIIDDSERVGNDEAVRAITDRILTLNPSADKKKIARFIQG